MFAPMLYTNRFMDNFFDDFFDFRPVQVRDGRDDLARLMRTDVKETKDGCDLSLEMPGFAKEDIRAELKDGYLTVSASHEENKEEKDEKEEKVIRRERFTGSVKRSFYVGKEVTEADIKAGYKDGVLSIHIPKKEPELPEARRIQIA